MVRWFALVFAPGWHLYGVVETRVRTELGTTGCDRTEEDKVVKTFLIAVEDMVLSKALVERTSEDAFMGSADDIGGLGCGLGGI